MWMGSPVFSEIDYGNAVAIRLENSGTSLKMVTCLQRYYQTLTTIAAGRRGGEHGELTVPWRTRGQTLPPKVSCGGPHPKACRRSCSRRVTNLDWLEK